jgi:hypothetical protein
LHARGKLYTVVLGPVAALECYVDVRLENGFVAASREGAARRG